MDIIVKQPYETTVICDTCKQRANRRQVDIGVIGVEIRQIAYDTHADCQTESEHAAALGRMKVFHQKLFSLVADIKAAIGTDAFKLSIGRITEIDLGNVIPTACNPRTDIVPTVTVRAFKRDRGVFFPARPLEGLTLETLLDLVRPDCDRATREIQEIYEAERHPGDDD